MFKTHIDSVINQAVAETQYVAWRHHDQIGYSLSPVSSPISLRSNIDVGHASCYVTEVCFTQDALCSVAVCDIL